MNPTQYAINILASYWDYSLPVNPVAIAEDIGLQVFYDDDLPVSAQFDDETRSIFVNSSEKKTRQRFSIAHEIGHAVMGHGTSPRENWAYTVYNYEKKEFDANEFAAELLMPKEAIESLIFNQEKNFQELCSTFDVSYDAMRIRLRRLGYSLW